MKTRRLTAPAVQPTLMALAMMAALPAIAQQQPQPQPQPQPQGQPQGQQPGEPMALPTVTITATKRPEKQREVAGSVSVLQGDDLERRDARSQEDALKLSPGVQINKGDPADNLLSIRGIGTSSCSVCPSGSQTPTGVYLEDVPLSEPAGKVSVIDLPFFDFERLEVLRGPQGALYGSASLGGALRYLVNKPFLGGIEGTLLGGGSKPASGDFGHTAYGMVNVPFAKGTAGARAQIYDIVEGGYIDNVGTGEKDANKLRLRGGRVVFGWKPSAALDATLVALTHRTKQDDTFRIGPDPDKLEISSPTPSTRETNFDFASLTVNYNLGSHTLSSITGYWKKKLEGEPDVTTLIRELFGDPTLPPVITRGDLSNRATSQELRIASNPGGPLSYVAGVFYQRSRAANEQFQDVQPFFTLTQTGTAKASEKAVFADGELALGRWSVGLGGRYSRTSLDADATTDFGAGPSDTSTSVSESSFTPKASVKYRFGDHLWYALAAKGFRFGGVNPAAPDRPFKSDSLWTYETGLRLNFSRSLLLDVGVFLIDWKDTQVSSYDTSLAVPQTIVTNVGQARSKGVEALLQYRVTPDFDIAAAVAYTDAKTTVDFVSGVTRQTIAAGARLPGTARWQTALQAAYRFAGPFATNGRLIATHTHVGERVMDLDAIDRAPSYNTVDLGASLSRDAWTLAVNLANVFDEHGILGVSPNIPITYKEYNVQRPRTLYVSLRYDF